jgi:hypothetical protein
MFANKLILHALAILMGPLSPVGVALAQQTSGEPDCEDIRKNTAKPAKATATVRGEFLKNGKTLVQDISYPPATGREHGHL